MDSSRAPGPAPTYSSSHVLLVLLRIGGAEVIGRHALAKDAGLGEGAVRTVIKWLKEDGYITVEPSGCQLTVKGKQAYSELKRVMPKTLELSRTGLTVGREQVAILVKKKANRVKSGLEQRDSSIKAGAAGATTYVIKNSKFQVPGSSADSEKDYPSGAWVKLRSELQPEDGDVVIVCGSDDRHASFVGAISAALTLLT
jgi:DNA-binding MarR family transcriptional regulator